MKIQPNFPLQYIWVLRGGSTPVTKYRVVIDLKDGRHEELFIRENETKRFTLHPDEGFIPPENITINTPSVLVEYDQYTGVFKLSGVTGDISVFGECRPTPHTNTEISNYEHEEIKKLKLTHNQLGGVFKWQTRHQITN